MMEINHTLLDAMGPTIDLQAFLALLPSQAMEAEEISIRGLKNMLFSVIPLNGAQLNKVGSISDLINNAWPVLAGDL